MSSHATDLAVYAKSSSDEHRPSHNRKHEHVILHSTHVCTHGPMICHATSDARNRECPTNNLRSIRFITIPEMHHNNVSSSSSFCQYLPCLFRYLLPNRINLRTKQYRKCHKPEPVGIFYTVRCVNLFDQ